MTAVPHESFRQVAQAEAGMVDTIALAGGIFVLAASLVALLCAWLR